MHLILWNFIGIRVSFVLDFVWNTPKVEILIHIAQKRRIIWIDIDNFK